MRYLGGPFVPFDRLIGSAAAPGGVTEDGQARGFAETVAERLCRVEPQGDGLLPFRPIRAEFQVAADGDGQLPDDVELGQFGSLPQGRMEVQPLGVEPAHRRRTGLELVDHGYTARRDEREGRGVRQDGAAARVPGQQIPGQEPSHGLDPGLLALFRAGAFERVGPNQVMQVKAVR